MTIGFCCIMLAPDGTKVPRLKSASATVAHVAKLSKREGVAYLRRAADSNLEALYHTVYELATLPREVRMFRITSGLLPLYTHALGKVAYLDPGYVTEYRAKLARIGKLAREQQIRLSFHPGQYAVLNSERESVRRAAVEEFEYHTRMAHYMGFSGGNAWAKRLDGAESKDGFAINVHGGKWHGDRETSLASWDWAWSKMSVAARRMITLENDEFGWAAEDILALCQKLGVRMVPDVHHHWVRTGEWLDPESEFVRNMRATWGAIGPKMHVSLPAVEYFTRSPFLKDEPINLDLYKRFNYALPGKPPEVSMTLLRAHSNYIYHPGMAAYLSRWVDNCWSIQVESKAKNLAAHALWAAIAQHKGKPVYFARDRQRWLVGDAALRGPVRDRYAEEDIDTKVNLYDDLFKQYPHLLDNPHGVSI